LLFAKYFHNIGIMEDRDVIKALAALAQPHRALVVAGQAGLTPGHLTEQLDIPANTLSFHLKELTAAGLISQTRDGRHLIYRAAFEQMNALLAYLTANCCQGNSCDLASPGTPCC
jgi:ArsR family transcriptional regulator